MNSNSINLKWPKMGSLKFYSFAAIFGSCAISACGGNSEVAETLDLEYPPVESVIKVVPQVEPQFHEASEVALHANILALDGRTSQGKDELERLKKLSAGSAYPEESVLRPPAGYMSTTGARTVVAVAVEEIGESRLRVSICGYPTPGLWGVYSDGRLVLSPIDEQYPFHLSRPTVEWTDAPAADGIKPSAPRWLVIDSGILTGTTREDQAEICGPHAPDPQPVVPPEPTTKPR